MPISNALNALQLGVTALFQDFRKLAFAYHDVTSIYSYIFRQSNTGKKAVLETKKERK